jgi:RNA-directed DNA polymerase
MMHGTEQSDPLIVPMKPVNKAVRIVAEPVEGSGGTKRNVVLQSTDRTQSRESVSQAQDRIRESVNRNNKERLTALLHHVDIDCLRWAFFSLKKRAAPGVDEVTWDQYAEQIEDNLVDLHARSMRGRIERCRPAGGIYRKRMADSGRSASPRLRTRLSRRRWWRS